MSKRRPAPPHHGVRLLDVEHAEAALLDHYARLVRLVYVTLPRDPGRHARVLAAHAAVQRALPRRGLAIAGPREADPARTGPPDAYPALRTRALKAALARDARPGRLSRPWSRWTGPGLPTVWGLRVFPQSGGAEELVLDRTLGEAGWPVRAAFALLVLEGLRPEETAAVLRDLAVAEPERAVRAAQDLAAEACPGDAADARPAGPFDRAAPDAAAVAASPPSAVASAPAGESEPDGGTGPDHPAASPTAVLLAPEFDPCLLHARPTDLLRRRHRMRATGTVLLLATAAVVVAALSLPGGSGDGGDAPAAPSPVSRASRVGQLLRTPSDLWADTARLDFTAWPARGARAEDRPLLGRALRAWSDPAWRGRRVVEPGAAPTGSGQPPRLLYAGDVDGRAVVVLHDGPHTVHYSEPLDGTGGPDELVSALTDGADVTTAAAVVLTRTSDSVRLLLAPWIAGAGVRDLLAPGTPARAVTRSGDGVTEALPLPPTAGDCRTRHAVELRSSARVVEDHAFLLADLGGLSPTHLTYMPAPVPGVRPRPPQEATGPLGLRGWSRAACRLDALRGQGVRAVNHWVFATQPLPERAGQGTWVCARADTWRGPGRVEYLFLGPDGTPARPVGGRRDTAECSRFGQDVLAETDWQAPSGAWYLLAAGSRSLARVESSAPVRATATGSLLAVRTPPGAKPLVTGRLADGSEVRAAR